jgi:hypothetical protein
MAREIRIPFTQMRIGRFLFLLISITLTLVLRPFLEGFVGMSLLVDIFFTLVIMSGIYASLQSKRLFYIALIIALPALAAHWASYFPRIPSTFLIGEIFGALFYTFLVTIILSYLFTEKEITVDVIAGAVCVYLLIGLMWASFFTVLNILHPCSFKISENLGTDESVFTYYSFVTLTTLGYGDISPITAQARALAVMEAVAGPIYLAILVARLMAIHVSQTFIRD